MLYTNPSLPINYKNTGYTCHGCWPRTSLCDLAKHKIKQRPILTCLVGGGGGWGYCAGWYDFWGNFDRYIPKKQPYWIGGKMASKMRSSLSETPVSSQSAFIIGQLYSTSVFVDINKLLTLLSQLVLALTGTGTIKKCQNQLFRPRFVHVCQQRPNPS